MRGMRWCETSEGFVVQNDSEVTGEELPWQTFHLALKLPPNLINASIPELRGRGQTHLQMTLAGGESKT